MMESEYTYIRDAEDFAHYCARIDNSGKPFVGQFDDMNFRNPKPYAYQHEGEPTSYPCLVQSNFEDDPNGPYLQYHSFVYLTDAAWLVRASLSDLIAERDYYKEQFLLLQRKVLGGVA